MNYGSVQTCLPTAIRGKIGNPQDDPVASARVILSGSKLAQKISTLTGSEGNFIFSRIPPGTYTLEVNYAGFGKLVQRGISVREHAITGMDLKMDILKDSRTLKLRALSLEYIVAEPKPAVGLEPSRMARQLNEVVAGLRLDRALFNPPSSAKVGRGLIIEFGIYQNLKETIMRRLRERKIDLFDSGQIAVALTADLQAAGCLLLPKTLPRQEISASRYVEWRWQVVPQAFGRGLVRLDLRAVVDFKGLGGGEKNLLVLDREILIRKNRWLAWTQRVRRALGDEDRPGHPGR